MFRWHADLNPQQQLPGAAACAFTPSCRRHHQLTKAWPRRRD